MTNLTTLQAVNELLDAVGEHPFAAVDTGGTSVAGQAERFLDAANIRIQTRGWYANTETNGQDGVLLNLPTTTVATSEGAGTFIAAETVTGGTSDATGRFHQIDGTTMYLSDVTGTFQAAETLTGGTSAATRTSGVVATVTEAEIVLAANVLDVEAYGTDFWRNLGSDDGKLRDLDDNTTTFTSGRRVKLAVLKDFTALTHALQQYIVAEAAVTFQQRIVGSRERDAVLRAERQTALTEAVRANDRRVGGNILHTAIGRQMTGSRSIMEGLR